MMNDIREIQARQAAVRYAQMVVAVAATEQRVTELQQRVEDAEYFRLIAESQLSAATWPEGIGEILHVGTAEPDESVSALLDIYGGRVYRRAERGGDAWVRAEVSESGATFYEWPIEEAGPFLKLQDGWYIRKIIDAVRGADERRLKLRNRFSQERGYCPEGESRFSFNQIDPADGAIRVYNDLWSRFCEQGTETHGLKTKLAAAEREIERLKASTAEAA